MYRTLSFAIYQGGESLFLHLNVTCVGEKLNLGFILILGVTDGLNLFFVVR